MDKIIRIEGNILLVNRKSFFNIHLTIQSDFSNISLSNSHYLVLDINVEKLKNCMVIILNSENDEKKIICLRTLRASRYFFSM
jgi:hypothetical protein